MKLENKTTIENGKKGKKYLEEIALGTFVGLPLIHSMSLIFLGAAKLAKAYDMSFTKGDEIMIYVMAGAAALAMELTGYGTKNLIYEPIKNWINGVSFDEYKEIEKKKEAESRSKSQGFPNYPSYPGFGGH